MEKIDPAAMWSTLNRVATPATNCAETPPQFARHQAADGDDHAAGERRDDVDRHEAVAGNDAQQRRKPAHEGRLIDVAGLEVPAIGDVVQLVTKVAVAPRDEHVGHD